MEWYEVIIFLVIVYNMIMVGLQIVNIMISYANKEKSDFDFKKTLLYTFIIVANVGIDYYLTTNFKAVGKGLIVGLYFAGFIILFIFFFKYVILYAYIVYFKFVGTSSVKNISNLGFEIVEKGKTTQISWYEIRNYELSKGFSRLILYSNRRIVIKNNVNFFYLLLKNIPKEINAQNTLKITNFFNSLGSCAICGHFAVKDKFCLNCMYDTYDSKSGKTESEYIIENQLDVFATLDKKERFNEFKTENQGFSVDTLWKPIVTKREVLEYSEKECWDK